METKDHIGYLVIKSLTFSYHHEIGSEQKLIFPWLIIQP
jgi:hypothetical protein